MMKGIWQLLASNVLTKEQHESWSNLAYAAVGILAVLWHDDLLFGWAMVSLGVGSFIYHSRRTEKMFMFDWWAMVFVMNVVIGTMWGNKWVWIGMMVYNVLYGFVFINRIPSLFKLPSVFIEIGIISVPTLISVWLCRPLVVAIIVTLIFIVALVIRSSDEDPKQLRFHDSIEHSIWHYMTAIGFYLTMYLHLWVTEF